MRNLLSVLLLIIPSCLFGQTNATKELPLIDVEVEYLLPKKQLSLPNTSEAWETGAPKIGDVCVPSSISYDDGHIIAYLKSREHKDGHGNYSVIHANGKEFDFGAGIIELGNRFHEKELVRFVESRLSAETVRKKFNVQFRAFVLPNDKFPVPKRSPWEMNVVDAVTLLGRSYCDSASDTLFKLAKTDPDEWIRNASFNALGRLSTVKPSIRKELDRIAFGNKEMATNVREAYRIAGNVGPQAAILAVHYSRSERSVRAYKRNQLARSNLELLQRVHFSSCANNIFKSLDSKEDRIRDAMLWGLTKIKIDGSVMIQLPMLEKLETLQEKLNAGEIDPSKNFTREQLESNLATAMARLGRKMK